MPIKISRKNKLKYQMITGFGFLGIGLYMIIHLKDVRGQIPLFLATGILLWRFR